MPASYDVLQLVNILVLGLGAGVLILAKSALTSASKSITDSIVKQLDWKNELARQLEQARGTERQELRLKSYGVLWSKLRPLAIYDDEVIERVHLVRLSNDLSDWYFSETGGLLLTTNSRHLYFALQDTLRAAARVQSWTTERPDGASRDVFIEVLRAEAGDEGVQRLDDLRPETPDADVGQEKRTGLAKTWREDAKKVAARWGELTAKQRFATLQQIGSVLRTGLCLDVESRIR